MLTKAILTIAAGMFLGASSPLHAAVDGLKCREAKARGAGKEAFDFLKAHGKKRNDVKLSSDISKAESKFAKSFSKAESKGECVTSGDADNTEAHVTAFTLDAIDEICPPRVSGETFDIPSSAEPAETPGSPGVVVANPDLITQFGVPDFSLNNARYTRWRLRGPEQAPDGDPCTSNEDCGECTEGYIGAPCDTNGDCDQSMGLDSTQLSVERGRRDIVNQTQAANIDIPVICFGGSNGLTPVPANYLGFAESIGPCGAPSCDGTTPRIVDESLPNPAFPTFGGEAGGFEVHITEGIAHNDITNAEDDADNNVLAPLSDFIARNTQ